MNHERLNEKRRLGGGLIGYVEEKREGSLRVFSGINLFFLQHSSVITYRYWVSVGLKNNLRINGNKNPRK
jgi:hypothetical protein